MKKNKSFLQFVSVYQFLYFKNIHTNVAYKALIFNIKLKY